INNQLFRPSIYYSNSEIVVEDFTSEGCISLYDLQGKLISKNLIYAGATKIPIKEKGVVISVISSNKGSYTKKINILQ
ncbi:MAG: T9SS type A sorting domain-containing protein, partial [Bacteroidales bacterium]